MRQIAHNEKYKQVCFTHFDSSSKLESLPETSLTTTQGTFFHYRYPSYSCKCRRGYSLSSDPFNVWKLQEEPANESRGDIFRSYRLIGGRF